MLQTKATIHVEQFFDTWLKEGCLDTLRGKPLALMALLRRIYIELSYVIHRPLAALSIGILKRNALQTLKARLVVPITIDTSRHQ